MKLDRLLILPYKSFNNYVNLPPSILDKLSKNVKTGDKQYFFELKTSYGLSFNVGVKQFTAMDNTIEVPEWIADNIGEDFIDLYLLKNVAKGKYVKIQPQEKKFFNLPDNDVILEKALSEYCLLSINQTIKVSLLDEEYSIKILEIKSENNKNAKLVNIVNVDLNVDFDNKFPEEKKKHEKQQEIKNIPVLKPSEEIFKPLQEVEKELMIPSNLNPKNDLIESKGFRLDNSQDVQNYTPEEIRQKRLAYFQNKFAEQIKHKKDNELKSENLNQDSNNKKDMEI
jgi:hypothetical protein